MAGTWTVHCDITNTVESMVATIQQKGIAIKKLEEVTVNENCMSLTAEFNNYKDYAEWCKAHTGESDEDKAVELMCHDFGDVVYQEGFE
jgi:Tfp pilus assembly major pilin PilA